MKNKAIFTLIICMIAIADAKSQQTNESINLPKEWKVQIGDSSEYSKPDFDDGLWKTLQIGNFWQSQSYPGYNGIAWYRCRIVIPSSLKSNNSLFKSVRISLVRIGFNDVIYINGNKIGDTNGWELFRRVYIVTYNMINWDKENVITIRVKNTDTDGGMYQGPYSIYGSLRLSDIVIVKTNNKPVKFSSADLKFNKTLLFNFKIPVEKIKGTIDIKAYNLFSKAVEFHKEDNIIIGSKADSTYKLTFELKEPGTYKIDYMLTAESTPDTLKYRTLFAYNVVPRTNEHPEYPVVKLAVPDKSMPFDLGNMSFNGYLNDRLNANLTQRLLNIDETGILECYYNRPGKQAYVGEYAGKYLHAASRVWSSTKNDQLKAQMDRIVDILIACQNEDGYLGTYLPEDYWSDWDVWSHKYNMLGLLSYYSVTGYKRALEASVKIGDLLCRTFGENKGQRSILELSPHNGMASTSVLEPMTYLYRFTGDKKYLDFCYYILKAFDYTNGPKIVTALSTIGKVNQVADAKAYEMMSNLTGIVKLYQLTGDEKLLIAAENAWKDISTNRLYITGTASKGECFQDDFVLPAGNNVNMGEGCSTTTWLQFSQALYNLTGESQYFDEIEKTIYNHLLAAENPQTGCVSTYAALQGKKPYRCNIDGHCCMASIPRGIAAIPELAYTKNADNGFSINLYTGGKIADKITTKDGRELPVECTIDSKFPEEGQVTITMNQPAKTEFRLALRVPAWCRNFKANVDGRILSGIPGHYLNIEQSWDKNAVIKVSFDMNIQILDGGISYPGYIALKFGTQVLAIDQSLNPTIKDMDKISFDLPKLSPLSKTMLPSGWIGDQIYETKALYEGKPVEINLVPFADASQTGGDIRVWVKQR
jgi:DUF1680 family protein